MKVYKEILTGKAGFGAEKEILILDTREEQGTMCEIIVETPDGQRFKINAVREQHETETGDMIEVRAPDRQICVKSRASNVVWIDAERF